MPDSPCHRLTSLFRAELAATGGILTAQRRLLTEHFVETFQWEAIRPQLPLRLLVPPDVPPWQPRCCPQRLTRSLSRQGPLWPPKPQS